DAAAGLNAAARGRSRLVLDAQGAAPCQAGGGGAAVVVHLEIGSEGGRAGVEVHKDGRGSRDRERAGGGAGESAIAGSEGIAASGVDDEIAEGGDAVDGACRGGVAAAGEGAAAQGQRDRGCVSGDGVAVGIL